MTASRWRKYLAYRALRRWLKLQARADAARARLVRLLDGGEVPGEAGRGTQRTGAA